jgi:hypothetical protein
VSFAIVSDAGYMYPLQATAEAFRQTMSAWLGARGF